MNFMDTFFKIPLLIEFIEHRGILKFLAQVLSDRTYVEEDGKPLYGYKSRIVPFRFAN